jgi:hypothetical protein
LQLENGHDTIPCVFSLLFHEKEGAMPQLILPFIPKGATQINGVGQCLA